MIRKCLTVRECNGIWYFGTRYNESRTRGKGILFKTSLEKSLFSSPAACIKSIDARIKKLEKINSKMRSCGIIKKWFGSYADAIISAGMAKNIIRENDYEKDTYCSYSYNYLLYGSCIIYLREI